MRDYNTKKYSPEGIKLLHSVWLTTGNGDIFVKNIPTHPKEIHIRDLTVECEDLDKIFTEAIETWGIVLGEKDLNKVVGQIVQNGENRIWKRVYTININLTDKQKERILQKGRGKFLNYKNLSNSLQGLKKDEDFYNFFYKFIGYMEDMYSIN